MKRLFKAAKNQHVRASAAAGLKGSGAMPNSGSPTVDNSTGASEAVAVLSGRLGNALEHIDIEGDFRSHLTSELDRLDSKAACYANSSLAFCSSAQPWGCDWAEAELIALAWDCSLNVYGPTAPKTNADLANAFGLTKLQLSIPCSITGDTKATNCTIFTPTKQPGDGDVRSPYLIIAIRGSAGTFDNIVNLNGEPRDASPLFAFGGIDYTSVTFHAHAGFLNSAIKLQYLLYPQIKSFLAGNSRGNVLFTGHSAGGAVASLLHLSFRATFGYQFTGAMFSCITFGSPPVIKYMTPGDRLAVGGMIASARLLNIVNEYDLVARSDRRYILSMVQLYNSTDPSEADAGVYGGSMPTAIIGGDGRPPWSLPEPELFHIGPIVILKVGTYNSEAQSARESSSAPKPPGSRLIMSAWQITPEELSKIIFCRLSVHSRTVYRDRIQKLRNGQLNGETGW
ncbi:hypothetical protein Dda_4965 [Drechslerella dactyloides]|uniref:Fungal lipase-type domain-containing protein n=1 Tax=Drechslerella dactyloides TaxID=74499 RepID=A0AAD6IYB7_DREDA|nr:hypothetical protein Dda_4965 [Drechslerella dactyloides]